MKNSLWYILLGLGAYEILAYSVNKSRTAAATVAGTVPSLLPFDLLGSMSGASTAAAAAAAAANPSGTLASADQALIGGT